MTVLARPRVLLSLAVFVALTIIGVLFLKGPLEIPPLQIDPFATVGGYPVRGTVVQQWLAMIVFIGIAYVATRRMEVIPGRMQALVEMVVGGLLDLCERAAGRENGRRFFPVFATIFLFIAGANLLGFIPGTGTIYTVVPAHEEVHHAEEIGEPLSDIKLYVLDESGNVPVGGFEYELHGETSTSFNITGEEWEAFHEENPGLNAGHMVPLLRPANTDVNTTFAIAVWSFIFVEFWGITSLGLFMYMSKFFNVGRLLKGDLANGMIDVFVGFMDLVSELVRLLSFTFRLFGNVFAGEILILMVTFFVPLTFVIGVYFMEVFFGIIQAFIFAILTLIFGILAVSHHGGGEEHAGGEQHQATSH